MKIARIGPDGAYATRPLGPPDLPRVQGLFDRCRDYFVIATGAPAAADEAARAFVAGPPAKSVDDKRVVGVFGRNEELVGVLDALTNWPRDGVWMMGMLLIDPAHRRSGLGKAVHLAYEDWARSCRATELQTAVVSHHEAGIAFLKALGYGGLSTLDDYHAGAQRAQVLFFSKKTTE